MYFPALCAPCTTATTAIASWGPIIRSTTGVNTVDNPKPAGTVKAAAKKAPKKAITIVSTP